MSNPPRVSSKRRRVAIPPSLNHLSPSRTDYSLIDPAFFSSVLFRLEYAQHGPLTYAQSRTWTRAPNAHPVPSPPSEPSWATGDVRALGSRLHSEPFTAVVWARDVVGGDGRDPLRKTVVCGIEMWLLGKEFPLRSVCLVGMLAAVEEKEQKWIYHLDDGTALIQCVCALPRQPPASFLPSPTKSSSSTRALSLAGPFKPSSDPDNLPPAFRVGQLVRIVGRVSEGLYHGADLQVIVDSIEALKSHNSESEHHLTVAELHRSIYSQPFDLDAKLQAELEGKERCEPCSQAGSEASSEAGSPSKAQRRERSKKLPHPNRLEKEDLNLRNFKTYLLKTITEQARASSSKEEQKATQGVLSPAFSSSLVPTVDEDSLNRGRATETKLAGLAPWPLRLEDCGSSSERGTMDVSSVAGSSRLSDAPWPLRLPPPSPISHPTLPSEAFAPPPPSAPAFTLHSLQSSRTLSLLSTLIVQHLASLRLLSTTKAKPARALGPTTAIDPSENASWNRDSYDRATLLRPWKGGSARLLPPPGREKNKCPERRETAKAVLRGDDLERAKERLFADALRELRKEGVIVLAVHLCKGEPIASPKAVTPASRRWETSKWEVGWELKDPPRDLVQPILTSKFRSSSFSSSTFSSKSGSRIGWDLKDPPPDNDETPKKRRRPTIFDDEATPKGKAPRPIPRGPSSFAAFLEDMSAISAAPPPCEAFHLVTPSLLAPVLLRLLPAQKSAAIDEATLRERLSKDEVWDAVARKSDVVGKTLLGLEGAEKVEKFQGRWRRKIPANSR